MNHPNKLTTDAINDADEYARAIAASRAALDHLAAILAREMAILERQKVELACRIHAEAKAEMEEKAET